MTRKREVWENSLPSVGGVSLCAARPGAAPKCVRSLLINRMKGAVSNITESSGVRNYSHRAS